MRKSIAENICYADVIKSLGLAPQGGNIKTIQRIVVENNIPVDHFNPGIARRRNKRNWSFDEIFCEDSKYHRTRLRSQVLQHKIIKYRCAKCDNKGEWQGEDLPLDLDHINGDNKDNRIENLRFLCPNCHRQTDTWGKTICP